MSRTVSAILSLAAAAVLLLAAPAVAQQFAWDPPPDVDTLAAGAQPTPWPAVGGLLNLLKPQPDEVLLDPGCGYDARLLIAACRYYGVEKAIGVEIDPVIAESARRHVEFARLSDRIEIITGDSTKLNITADVGVAYLWPDTLEDLRPKIEKLDRFACYEFGVPGLQMTERKASNGGKLFLWKPQPPVAQTASPASTPVQQLVPITRTVDKIVRLPRGSYCEVCGSHCRNPMAHKLSQQVVGYQPAVAQPATPQPSGRWVREKVCVNGVCSYRWKFVPDSQ